ncbi:ABC transporter ATP-binding protein [Pontibacillus salicampi]|uniref:ABC transporter ATP-binding protein n=1 Tax=Pontibacillus salicampi TaxID=1449801 RepID=A0ABV6LRM3_9BACI
MMMLIELSSLQKKFSQHEAVKSINVTIQKGEIFGLLGPNGAGKSTTISMIATLLKPTSGDIRYKGASTLHDSRTLRASLGYVPQELAIYPEFTAKENAQFFAKLYKVPKKERQERIDSVLYKVGLLDRASEKVERFSGGMKRRLNIACALLHKPDVLMLDEPTVGIDPQSRNYILEMVKDLNTEGMTILYTSHYMEEVEFLCDRIAIMDHGDVIALGTREELTDMMEHQDIISMEAAPMHEEFQARITELPDVSYTELHNGILQIGIHKQADVLPEIFTIAKELGMRIRNVEVTTPRLEDVFLYLTGRKLRDE